MYFCWVTREYFDDCDESWLLTSLMVTIHHEKVKASDLLVTYVNNMGTVWKYIILR